MRGLRTLLAVEDGRDSGLAGAGGAAARQRRGVRQTALDGGVEHHLLRLGVLLKHAQRRACSGSGLFMSSQASKSKSILHTDPGPAGMTHCATRGALLLLVYANTHKRHTILVKDQFALPFGRLSM